MQELTDIQPDCLAQSEAVKMNMDAGRLYAGQFQVSLLPAPPIAQYETIDLGRRYLHHCPKLDVTRFFHGGTLCAILLGVAIGANGNRIASEIHLTVPPDGDPALSLEAAIAALVGRFCVITHLSDRHSVYTDTVGEMGVVYDLDQSVVGSTLPLILHRPIAPRDDIIHDRIAQNRGHYALGYTRDRRCERLLPNHRLDLDTLQQHRFWPRDNDLAAAGALSFDAVVGQIIALLRQNTIGFLNGYKTLFALSGGQDSRMLLGAARDHVHLATTVFATQHNWISGQDCVLAEAISHRLGLKFRRIHGPKVGPWGQRLFHARVGYDTNAGGIKSFRAYNKLPEDHLVIRGNVFGLTRATDWLTLTGASVSPFDVGYGIDRLRMDEAISADIRPTDLSDRYLAWRESLPPLGQHNSHDFSFCENYLPNSLGARNYCHTNIAMVNPFADRRIITLCLAVPPDLRLRNVLNIAILSQVAADLHDLPFV